MTFAQCSISDMFQHRNHDDFTTVAGVVALLDSFLLFYVDFFSLKLDKLMLPASPKHLHERGSSSVSAELKCFVLFSFNIFAL